MKKTCAIIRFALVLGLASSFAMPETVVAAIDPATPLIIQSGFKSWAAKDASYAFDIWKKGGLLETDSKPVTLARYFSRMDRTLGKFKSYEIIDSKPVGESSRIIYLAVNFEQAAVYARFLVYRADKDWIIQNMDFSPKPEAIMPWLAFTGTDYNQ